ncbi:hypothetical protein LAG90_15815 [Marinilongibacter aquaticus]|uniref:hypothetical protein n=1 Tax=Marinilongibacter aquaticus TaxID=2975157 RepID=UPI0021BD6CBB|nr:hypothetical protein [Marinilongibacter aquaticus]UBM58271.1 hypothetical protein LAG90_15815 [Marinilongibacter aquaticus]
MNNYPKYFQEYDSERYVKLESEQSGKMISLINDSQKSFVDFGLKSIDPLFAEKLKNGEYRRFIESTKADWEMARNHFLKWVGRCLSEISDE